MCVLAGMVAANNNKGREWVMQKLLVTLLIVGGVSLFASGCKIESEDKSDSKEQVGQEIKEHPKAEHPVEAAAPKDHPAH